MPKYIQVGSDVVEFPDDMSDAQIAQALSGEPAVTPPSSGFLMGLKDPITGGAQLLPRALAGVTSLGGIAPNPVSQFFTVIKLLFLVWCSLTFVWSVVVDAVEEW